jgi:Phage tail lysozyme
MADNATSWMDFAQRSRDEGGLGLEKHQAAGVVGNLVNESGEDLPAWGPSGDNGTAWGTAQWRGDRLEALKAHAQANGTDYRTPEAQQAFMRHEFDTTENPAYQAILAAKTPEDAATAMNTRYERSADTTGHREARARQFYDGPTDGPTAIQHAMRSPQGQAMGFAPDDNSQGALSPQVPPGALSAGGAPPSQPTWLDALGQTLMNMAPGIAQDPDHAKALASVAAAQQKVAASQGTWSTEYNPVTGIATQTNSLDPSQRRQFRYAAPKPEKVEKDPVQQAADIGRVKSFQDLSDSIAKNAADSRASLDTVVPIQEALKNPNVPQGFGGETLALKNKALASLPNASEETKKTASDTDVAVSGINKMVQEGRTLNGGMPGSLSDKDIVFLKQSQAGLGNTPEANQRIIDIYKQLHQRRIEMDQARQDYVSDRGAHPLGLDEGFRKQINEKWAAENKARDEALAASEAAAKTTNTSPATKLNKTSNGVSWSIN